MKDLGQSFLAVVERDPDALAIVDGTIRKTYGQWLEDIGALVGALNSHGYAKGSHIVTVLQNRYEAATLHWACQLGGQIITPINWRASAAELDYAIDNSGARLVVYETATESTVTQAGTANNIGRLSMDADSGATHQIADCFNHSPCTSFAQISPEDTSLMLYTSGTTGRGKGVPRSHRAERAAAVAHIAQNQYARGETTLGVMPLYHTMGVRSLLASALLNGTFVCQRRFSASQALELIQLEEITNLYLVPTLYHDLLQATQCSSADLSSVTKLGYAGATMTDGLLRKVDQRFQPDLFVNHYGSSEVYTFTVEPAAASKPGSAGKAGLNQRIRLVKLDANNHDDMVAPNEEGQIIASLDSEEAFDGYWKRPDADAKSIREGWYYTGDVGYLDADGDLFVTGRVDDMVISGGENILPAEIESVLSLHAGVIEVAIAGLADERLGQQVAAFVKRRGDVSEADLDAWCRNSELAPFKRPRTYVFVSDIPKSPVGKILRRKLISGDYSLDH